MNEKIIDEALKYANASNEIENMYLTDEEFNEVREAVLNNRSSKSFLYELYMKVSEKKNGQNKR